MKTIIKKTLDGKYRVIENLSEITLSGFSYLIVSIEVQVKRRGFLCFGYETIKEWPLTQDNDDDDYDFYVNEAIELFDKIVHPYKA